jgi:hypothetical protein
MYIIELCHPAEFINLSVHNNDCYCCRLTVDTLLAYHNTYGCPYSTDDITIGHCLLLATNYTLQCQDASKQFISIADKHAHHWLSDKHNTMTIRENVAAWQVEKTNDFQRYFKRLVFYENNNNNYGNNTRVVDSSSDSRFDDNSDSDSSSGNNNNNNNKPSSSQAFQLNMSPEQCQASYSQRSFLPSSPSQILPPMLYTFPGSGNSWCRLLVEYATGIYSGPCVCRCSCRFLTVTVVVIVHNYHHIQH